jgi:hypothetical protein
MADFPIGSPLRSAEANERSALAEMVIAGGVFFVLLTLRLFYATNQPWDSDEPQHLHVVWAWANGLLPYKDVFDNHSPLFQALSAPIFALLGERADIVTAMRWVIMAVSVLPVGSVLVLGRRIVPDKDGRAEFDVVIPAKYTIIGENGLVAATLDGIKVNGSCDLYPGSHDLVLPSPNGKVFVIWSRAFEKGFSPFTKAH